MNGYGVCEATVNFTARQQQEPSSFIVASDGCPAMIGRPPKSGNERPVRDAAAAA